MHTPAGFDSLLPGHATLEGTAAYRQRFAERVTEDHYRPYQSLLVSSIGVGTYLGDEDEETDRLYREVVERCLAIGCNVIDTAINYRCQRSERSVGAGLRAAIEDGTVRREEAVVATKGGFLPFDGAQPTGQEEYLKYIVETFLKPEIIRKEDIVAGCHCMAPAYLQHQIDASRRNLGLECLDVYYLHNPEFQLQEVDREVFLARLKAAFEILEMNVSEGKIRRYGTATWSGYRQQPDQRDYLDLSAIVEVARRVGGEDHHFRAIQLPLNLAMPEAIALGNQKADGRVTPLLQAAHHFGISVMASASIYRGRVAKNLPEFVGETFPGFSTDAQRAIQFVRSTPGMSVALVGMRRIEHVEENWAVARVPPVSTDDYVKLFRNPEGEA